MDIASILAGGLNAAAGPTAIGLDVHYGDVDQGRNAYTGPGQQLLNDPKVIALYLGTLAQVG